MANINAMLGLPESPSAIGDLSKYQKQLDSIKNNRKDLDDEIEKIKKILASPGGFNKNGYRIADGTEYTDADGKKHIAKDVAYAGMHRDQLTNRLASLQEKNKTLATKYQGIQSTYNEVKRQNKVTQSATEAAQNSGVQPIRAFQFDGTNFNQDPSYQFRLNQGLDALDRRYAARGGLGSGNRLTGITDYAQGLASTEYQNAFERGMAQWRTQFDVLNANLSAAGIGQRAQMFDATNRINADQSAANTIMTGAQLQAGLYGQGGETQAAGIMGSNSARQQSISDLAYIAGNSGWFNSQNQQVDVPYYKQNDVNNFSHEQVHG
jgi:hypothetical protein